MNSYRALDRNMFQYSFLVFGECDNVLSEEISRLGGRIYYSGKPTVKNIFPFLKKTIETIKKTGPYDAVHCHADIANAWPLFAAFLTGIPNRIAHSHSVISPNDKMIKRMYYEIQKVMINVFSNTKMACSELAGTSLFGGRVFSKRGNVLPNAIPANRFTNVPTEEIEKIKNELCIDSQNLVIGNITRFDQNKNQGFIVDVFYKVLQEIPNAVLILGGPDAGELKKIQNKILELGIQGHVRLIGERNDVPAILKVIDVYLFPSISEGFGYAVIEAQASGCLCFSSTGVPKNVDMGLGTLSRISLQESPEQWKNAIVEQSKDFERLKNDDLYTAVVARGFDIGTMARCISELYKGKITEK